MENQTNSATCNEIQDKKLNDLKGSIKWIGDNLGTGADALFIELQDEHGITVYVSPNELLASEAFNRLSSYCKSRIESGLAKTRTEMH